jgi:hypothetical protein
MDSFYWIMTKEYTRLFMYNQLFANSYIQEYGSPDVYKVTTSGSYAYQGAMPHQAPVLLVPSGFRSAFSGSIISDSIQVLSYKSSLNDNPGAGISLAGGVVYPNPVNNGELMIDFSGRSPTNATLYSLSGQVMVKKVLTDGINVLNVRQLPHGVYVLTLWEKNKKNSYKIFIGNSSGTDSR